MNGEQGRDAMGGQRESIIILDEYGVIQWSSPSVYNLLGYLPREIMEKEIFGFVHKASAKRLKKLYYQLQERSSRSNEGLVQFQNKKGEKTALFVTFNNLSGAVMNGTMLHLQQFNPEKTFDTIRIQREAELEIELRRKIEQEIAAELHDHVNPTLVAVKLMLDYSLRNLELNLDELEKLPGILDNLIHTTRNLSHSITKEALMDFELQKALSSLSERFVTGSNLRIVLKYDKLVETLLRGYQKVHLVRIIEEQIMNILKHASASKVLISFQFRNERIILVTRDNGSGFDPQHRHKGIGLSNMYNRVNLLGGNMHINSSGGEGTTITIALPVN
ncbi:MAG TPA: ATP-binding protein [Puia sp.]|nr:ATP-binding protein [Puia sp.]